MSQSRFRGKSNSEGRAMGKPRQCSRDADKMNGFLQNNWATMRSKCTLESKAPQDRNIDFSWLHVHWALDHVCPGMSTPSLYFNDYFLFSSFHSLAKDKGELSVLGRGAAPYPYLLGTNTADFFVNWSFSRGHSDHNFQPRPLSWWSFLGNWTQWEECLLLLLSLWVSIFLLL